MHVVSTHPSDHRHTNALKAALADIEAPGWAVVFGDRRDMLEAALALHYEGVRLVHVGGGDTPHGTDSHPDHRTRDAISMLARVHCVANQYAYDNLCRMPFSGDFVVAITGSPGLDGVLAYARTLDPNRKREGVFEWFPERCHTGGLPFYEPLNDAHPLSPELFLHKLAHCELFRSNSSAALYEARILKTSVELVGDRQAGRTLTQDFHHPEGRACEAIRKVVMDVCVRRG